MGSGTGVKFQIFLKDLIRVEVSQDFTVSDLNQLSYKLMLRSC